MNILLPSLFVFWPSIVGTPPPNSTEGCKDVVLQAYKTMDAEANEIARAPNSFLRYSALVDTYYHPAKGEKVEKARRIVTVALFNDNKFYTDGVTEMYQNNRELVVIAHDRKTVLVTNAQAGRPMSDASGIAEKRNKFLASAAVSDCHKLRNGDRVVTLSTAAAVGGRPSSPIASIRTVLNADDHIRTSTLVFVPGGTIVKVEYTMINTPGASSKPMKEVRAPLSYVFETPQRVVKSLQHYTILDQRSTAAKESSNGGIKN
jgi:hypothetical protein